ncbi:iron uptake system protein EfeO [Streptomyces sp. NPDC058486]|uniref:iron uptake system protein EfeO n=1 Tax=unclassified Streptomyces TaxID=2593676 RepID=UPI0036571356
MRAVRTTVAVVLVAVSGCTVQSGGGEGGVTVISKDGSCEVSQQEFRPGRVTVRVENRGSKVTGVRILRPDDRVVAERENVGASTWATLTAELGAGSYTIVCRPGMTGGGLRQAVTVTLTGGSAPGAGAAGTDAVVAAYRQYLQAQAEETLPRAKVFTDAVRAGDLEAAKKAYAPSRIGWGRTEPVADSFGGIGAKVDVREDGSKEGQGPVIGWHALEKALWRDKRITTREKQLADRLDKDLADWVQRVGTAEITPASMADGARRLLAELATGEREPYSPTDLVGLKANVEGAQKAFELLKPAAARNDAALVAELDRRFAALNTLLDRYRADRTGYDFTPYDKVGEAGREELSDGVDALAEPLSRLAAAVAK